MSSYNDRDIEMSLEERKYSCDLTCWSCGHEWTQGVPLEPSYDSIADKIKCPECGKTHPKRSIELD